MISVRSEHTNERTNEWMNCMDEHERTVDVCNTTFTFMHHSDNVLVAMVTHKNISHQTSESEYFFNTKHSGTTPLHAFSFRSGKLSKTILFFTLGK